MSLTDPPRPDCGFAERLDWLLAMVPRMPGESVLFSEDDLVTGLARLAPRDPWVAGKSVDLARQWLSSARSGVIPRGRLAGGFVAALEELFRLPVGYFRDDWVAEQVDVRIRLARDAAASGIRVLGPCRVLADEVTVEQLRQLYQEVSAALERRDSAR